VPGLTGRGAPLPAGTAGAPPAAAQQPDPVTPLERARTLLGESRGFTALHLATFSFPRPLGADIPQAHGMLQLASLPSGRTTLERGEPVARVPVPQITGSIPPTRPQARRIPFGGEADALDPPMVDWLFGDMSIVEAPIGDNVLLANALVRRQRAEQVPAAFLADSVFAIPTEPQEGLTMGQSFRVSRLLFGNEPTALPPGSFEPWDTDEAPIIAYPGHAEEDKQAGIVDPEDEEKPGQSPRVRSPAERLRLTGEARDKADRCLTEAIYFESRGEPVRGQMAVAQVIVNRAFSGFYPRDICGVVYQNSHMWRACQFTFTCDGSMRRGILDRPRWAIAERLAKEMLDGKTWLGEIGKATHYHAHWVSPWWTRTMTRIHTIGVHTFYRPRRWGDWTNTPEWRGGPAAPNRDRSAENTPRDARS
jgi:hypothetical protein